jgi:hypothetical protein
MWKSFMKFLLVLFGFSAASWLLSGKGRTTLLKWRAKRQTPTQVEPPPHVCRSTACKCMIPGDQEYCNSFCANVETSGELHRCGCGHMNCDLTKQLGNEETFERTTG